MNQLFDQETYAAEATKMANSIGIPSQPKVLTEISNEMKKPEADVNSIADIVSKDVALSAKLLKVINSVYFGLAEKVDSIHRALSLMGLKNFNKIILASAMKEVLCDAGQETERFWNHSMTTASVSSHVAREVGFPSEEQAYTAGLFHDCGIPLLMKKYPDYSQIIDYAMSIVDNSALSGKVKSIVGIEDERYTTHHCAIGYIISKSWNLSESVSDAIWYHHYTDIGVHKESETRRLAAILLVADYISGHILYLSGSECSVSPETEWVKAHEKVISELNLDAMSLKDLKEDCIEKYYEKVPA